MSMNSICNDKDIYVSTPYVHNKYLYVHDKDHEFAVRNKDFEK